MSKRNYGIESITDAFLALSEMDEEIVIPERKSKKLDEGASVNVRDTEDVELAQNFRKNDKKEENSTLEVIDVDADSLENLKDGKSYVGKMLLQCNSCKATRFIDIDKLVADENDKDLYNMEDECPHCHNTGTGYTLIGQVGKAAEENETPSLDNDEKSDEEAMFDNVDEVEGNTETEYSGSEESTETKDSEDDIEKGYDETDVEDDTEDLDLPELGDEFDVDDVMEDDTEDDDDEEDKSKKESLKEDYANKVYVDSDNDIELNGGWIWFELPQTNAKDETLQISFEYDDEQVASGDPQPTNITFNNWYTDDPKGQPREQILNDYNLTEQELDSIIQQLKTEASERVVDSYTSELD